MRHLIFSTTMPVLVVLLISCTGQKEPEDPQASGIQTGSLQLADQIIYDVIIKNPDPQDEWTEKCLVGLNRGELVDFIFAGLYDNRFKAYDIFNDNLIPARTIRKMEEDREFTRDHVSKIQFVEDWYADPEGYSMSKRVTEVRLGVEHFDSFGMHMGHNPLFKVRLVQ
ncbi:MAG: hypothetical protein V3V53_17850 [Bacteroidales bacterium]